MARPHPVLVDLAVGREVGRIDDAVALLRSGAEHRMSGLLWSAVKRREVVLPDPHGQRLAARQLAERQHHQVLWAALASLTEELEGDGLSVSTIKGVTAEARWYDSMGERPSVDLDLVVRADTVEEVDRAMAIIDPEHDLRPHLATIVAGTKLQSIDLNGPDDLWIDLHLDPLKLGFATRQAEGIWSRVETMMAPDGGRIRVLDAETSLLVHLFHALKDRFAHLIELVDVLRIIESEDLDWEVINHYLEVDGIEAPGWLALHRVFGLLGLDPLDVVRAAGWRPELAKLLWPERICLNGHAGRLDHHRRQMLLPMVSRGHLHDMASNLAFIVAPPTPMVEYYYPSTRGPYGWRVATGRWREARKRRKRVAQAR